VNDPLSRYLIRGARGVERDQTGVHNFPLYASFMSPCPPAIAALPQKLPQIPDQIVLRRAR